MHQPVRSGRELIEEIDHTLTATPTLWWLGHSGFVFRFADITFYIDPCFSNPAGRERRIASPLSGTDVHHADMIFSTHAHPGHMDTASLAPMLEQSRAARLVLPKTAADPANAAGIPYSRMTTTDSGLRIEYFKGNLYCRVYAVPSAHPHLDWTAEGGYPYLGYLIRIGRWTVYHAGDCAWYDELPGRLQPFNVTVALLPVGGRNFTVHQAAQLASEIGARWVVPMHYGTFDEDRESSFVAHMLGQRPEQAFKVFQCGERWTVPED